MNLTFLYLPGFVNEWKKLRLTAEDLVALERAIFNSRDVAPVVAGTRGLRKLRFAPPSLRRGKRGATRVGFAFFRKRSAIIVATIYAKNDAADLSPAQRSQISRLLESIEQDWQ
jgi:hypothetical protein